MVTILTASEVGTGYSSQAMTGCLRVAYVPTPLPEIATHMLFQNIPCHSRCQFTVDKGGQPWLRVISLKNYHKCIPKHGRLSQTSRRIMVLNP